QEENVAKQPLRVEKQLMLKSWMKSAGPTRIREIVDCFEHSQVNAEEDEERIEINDQPPPWDNTNGGNMVLIIV
ncbi:hypothetical protein KI387_021080, partial [Taxus chinensis]